MLYTCVLVLYQSFMFFKTSSSIYFRLNRTKINHNYKFSSVCLKKKVSKCSEETFNLMRSLLFLKCVQKHIPSFERITNHSNK